MRNIYYCPHPSLRVRKDDTYMLLFKIFITTIYVEVGMEKCIRTYRHPRTDYRILAIHDLITICIVKSQILCRQFTN